MLLLALLLLNADTALSADRIVDALWGESPPASAAKLVQHYVSQLRNKLGRGAIATVPPGYRAHIAAGSLDSLRFEQLLREGRDARQAGNPRLAAAILGRALALWRGAALSDLSQAGFASVEASRLDEARLDCAEERLAALLELGKHEEVLGEAGRLAAEHPHRERIRAVHMVALYRAGRQVEALEAFRAARKGLLEELGLEPGKNLRAVERAILRQDPALAQEAEPSASAPAPPEPITVLIGRERELGDLRSLALRADVRLVTLVGAGGSGKTRLARAVASESRRHFANGVAFVELAALRESALVLPTIAQELGVTEQARASPLRRPSPRGSRAASSCSSSDNFEQVADAGPELVRLVEAAPRLTVVVTSRRVLHLSGEQVFPVEPLQESDAAALFVARSLALDQRSTVSADDPDVRELCRRLDGLPLAVELAAARTRSLTPSQVLARLGERLTLLTGGPRDLPARQQTLRDTLDWSVALLSPTERTLLARLSVFPGDMSLAAAIAVAGGDLDTFARLVDDSMLQRNSITDPLRFTMLETVRGFALELLGRGARERCRRPRPLLSRSGRGRRAARAGTASLA